MKKCSFAKLIVKKHDFLTKVTKKQFDFSSSVGVKNKMCPQDPRGNFGFGGHSVSQHKKETPTLWLTSWSSSFFHNDHHDDHRDGHHADHHDDLHDDHHDDHHDGYLVCVPFFQKG